MTCAAMRAHQVLATVLFECSKSFCVRIREYFEENYQQKNEMQRKRTDVAIRQIFGARRPLPQDQKFRD